MSIRILTAVLGGAAITAGLLLAMSTATDRLRERDPTQYFSIVDFIPAPGGRRLPTPPPNPRAQPERPPLRYEPPASTTLSVEPPAIEKPGPAASPGVPAVPDVGRDASR